MLDVVTKQITPPTVYPVTVAEVERHARITPGTVTQELSSVLIPAATAYVEAMLKRQLVLATWRLSAPRFPCGFGILELPNPPLVAVTAITYVDSAGTTQAVSVSDYQVDTESEPGRVAPARGDSWPDPDSETLNAVQVSYMAGYGDTEEGSVIAIPAHIKLAIMVLCTHWYDRGTVDAPIMGAVKHSLDALAVKEKIEPPNYEDC